MRSNDKWDKVKSYNRFTDNNNNKYYLLHSYSAKLKCLISDAEDSASNHINGFGAQAMLMLITLS